MSDLLREERRKEISTELHRIEGILIELAELDSYRFPNNVHTDVLTQLCILWLNLNCVLDPGEKWNIDKEVITTLVKIPQSIPQLLNEIRYSNTQHIGH